MTADAVLTAAASRGTHGGAPRVGEVAMIGASDDAVAPCPEEATASRDDAPAMQVGRHAVALRWLACIPLHRGAHRWFPRYLGGYGRCSACGREWG